jgi:replicative DNA helicase
VASIAKREAYDAPGSLPPSAADLMDATLSLITSPVRNVRSTGLAGLDALLEGGFEPGTFTLIGGTAGTGKTALMLQIATHVTGTGTGVLFVTLEMGATRLLRRVLSQVSQVKFSHLKSGDLVEGEKIALQIAADRVRALPLWIETRVRTVEAVDAVIGEYDPGRIGLIFVDYAQKMSSPHGGDDRRGEVEHVSEMITKLAVSRNIPVVAASALSRPDSTRGNWRPTINNLRESAKLGHDADNVILLYRDQGAIATEVDICKQRDGATGATVLYFRGETLTFAETA